MGLFSKLKEGLTKTRDNIVSGIDSVFSGFSSIDDDFYEELEETMIMGDMGVRATEEIIEELKQKVKENKVKDPQACRQLLIDTIREKMDRYCFLQSVRCAIGNHIGRLFINYVFYRGFPLSFCWFPSGQVGPKIIRYRIIGVHAAVRRHVPFICVSMQKR